MEETVFLEWTFCLSQKIWDFLDYSMELNFDKGLSSISKEY